MSENPLRIKASFKTERYREGKNVRIEESAPAESQAAPSPPATRIARMLALACFVERQIAAGELKDYAEAARMLGVSRARMTQVVNLRWLPVETQEAILAGETVVNERRLRTAQSAAR